MDAAFLVVELHGELLRALSLQADCHFEGLAQASRRFPTLPTRLRRRVRDLDVTFNYIRHITKPLASTFFNEVLEGVAGSSSAVPPDRSPSPGARSPTTVSTPSSALPSRLYAVKRDLLAEQSAAYFDIYSMETATL